MSLCYTDPSVISDVEPIIYSFTFTLVFFFFFVNDGVQFCCVVFWAIFVLIFVAVFCTREEREETKRQIATMTEEVSKQKYGFVRLQIVLSFSLYTTAGPSIWFRHEKMPECSSLCSSL